MRSKGWPFFFFFHLLQLGRNRVIEKKRMEWPTRYRKKKKSKCRNRAFPSSFADPFWFFFLDEDEAAFPHLTTRGSLGVKFFFLSLLIAFGSVRTEAGGWAHSTFLPFFSYFYLVSCACRRRPRKKMRKKVCALTVRRR